MEFTTIACISLLLLTLMLLFHRYIIEPTKYWEKVGKIPYIPALSSSSPLISMLNKRPMHENILRKYKRYGKIFGQYEGTTPTICVADPELLRNIFVKDFQFFINRRDMDTGDIVAEKMVSVLRGEEWKRVRTIITPAFTTGKIKKMSSIFIESVKSVVKNLEEARKRGEPIDARRIFGAFTMDVIASSAFATKIDSHNNPDNPFLIQARKIFNLKLSWKAIVFVLFPRIGKLLGFRIFEPTAIEFFKEAALEIIKQRRKTGQVQNDFLQLLMEAADETAADVLNMQTDDEPDVENEQNIQNIGHEETNDHIFRKTSSYKSLSHDELVANCVIFFLAGYETTASTLAFASYQLAINPACQVKLITEIDSAIGRDNNQLTYEAVQRMKYLDNVISETLRLYPILVRLEREAEADYKLGDTGITIPKGMLVGIPIYGIHRDPEFYTDPEKFEPNRFEPDQKAMRNPYTYLPFGAGPRNCLGMRFALIEMKFCLAYLFSQFRFKKCAQTKIPLEFPRGQGLLQPKEVILAVERRTDRVWNGCLE